MINTRRDIPMLNLGPTRLALLVGALGALGCGSDAGVSTGGTGGTDGQTRTALAGKADCSPEVGAAVVCGVVYAADGVTPLPVVEVRLRDPSAGLSSKGVADPNKCITDAVGAFACILPEGTTGTTEFTVVAPGFDTLSFTVKVVEGEIAEADRLEMAAVCGDDTIRETETCDGIDLAGNTCADFGFTGGTLGCLSDCSSFDTSGCSGGPVCGDNAAEPPEVCDGTDLAGEDCASQGFAGGTLGCKADCTGFDTSSCSGGPVCGDNAAEPPEVCDGTDLAGEDCASQGFAGGTLGCKADCTGFDTSAARRGRCAVTTRPSLPRSATARTWQAKIVQVRGSPGARWGAKRTAPASTPAAARRGRCAVTTRPSLPRSATARTWQAKIVQVRGSPGERWGAKRTAPASTPAAARRGRCAVTTRPSRPRSATARTWQAKIVQVRGSPGERWGAKRTAPASTPAAARRGRCAVTTRPSRPRSATARTWQAKIVQVRGSPGALGCEADWGARRGRCAVKRSLPRCTTASTPGVRSGLRLHRRRSGGLRYRSAFSVQLIAVGPTSVCGRRRPMGVGRDR